MQVASMTGGIIMKPTWRTIAKRLGAILKTSNEINNDTTILMERQIAALFYNV